MARALWLVLLQLALVGCQVAIKIASDAPPTFIDELKEAKYMVGVLPEGTTPPPHVRTLAMRDANGTRYSCYIPLPEGQEASSSSEAAGQMLVPQQTPEQLLDALKEWCAYRVEDWWTYEVCYKRHVRQYHKEQATVVAQYVLGSYSEAESNLNAVHIDLSDVSGEGKFVSQQYSGGDVCELTGQPRATEVRYMCSTGGGDHVISSIKEPASCRYLITISTPRLCKHPEFRTEPPPVAAIRCIPLPTGEEAGASAAGAAGAGGTAGAAVAALAAAEEGQCATPGGACSSRDAGAAGTGSSGNEEQPGGSGSAGSEAVQPEGEQPAGGSAAPNHTAPPYGYEDEWDEAGYESLVDPRPSTEEEMDPQVLDEMYDVAMRELAREEEGGEEIDPEEYIRYEDEYLDYDEGAEEGPPSQGRDEL